MSKLLDTIWTLRGVIVSWGHLATRWRGDPCYTKLGRAWLSDICQHWIDFTLRWRNSPRGGETRPAVARFCSTSKIGRVYLQSFSRWWDENLTSPRCNSLIANSFIFTYKIKHLTSPPGGEVKIWPRHHDAIAPHDIGRSVKNWPI